MPPLGHDGMKMLHHPEQPSGRFWNIKIELTVGEEATPFVRRGQPSNLHDRMGAAAGPQNAYAFFRSSFGRNPDELCERATDAETTKTDSETCVAGNAGVVIDSNP